MQCTWTDEGTPLIWAQARDLDLQKIEHAPLSKHWLPPWQADLSRGRVSFDLRYDPTRPAAQRAQLDLRVRDGFVPLAPPGEGAGSLAQLDLDGTLAFQGHPERDLLQRDAWRGRLQSVFQWQGAELRLQSLLGQDAGAGDGLHLWLSTERIVADADLSKRLGQPLTLEDLIGMLDPKGPVALHLAARLPAEQGRLALPTGRFPLAARIGASGETSVAYVGLPNRRAGGVRNLGFPLRVEGAQGKVVFIADPSREFSQRTGIFDVSGQAPTGTVEIDGGIWAPPHKPLPREIPEEEPNHLLAQSRLAIRGRGLSFDDSMRSAFDGLAGMEGVREILATYGPDGGQLDVDLDFWGRFGAPNAANRLDIRGSKLAASWAPFPLPLQDVEIALGILSDGGGRESGRSAVSYRVEAQSSALGGEPVRLRGHNLARGRTSDRAWTAADVGRLNLRSSALARALQSLGPGVRNTFEQAHLAGWLEGQVHVVQNDPEARVEVFAQARPQNEGLRSVPSIFPIETSQMKGSIATRASWEPVEPGAEPPVIRWQARAEVLGHSGARNAGFPLALSLNSDPDGSFGARITTADVDVDSPLVVGAIGQYLTRESGRTQAFDARTMPLRGRISGDCELLFPPGFEGAPELLLALELDLDRFGPEGTTILRDLRGQVTLSPEDGSWRGEGLTGVLGDTPVDLKSVRVDPQPGSTRVAVDFSAQDVPIDRLHLEPFLEPELLRILIEDLDASGRFDIYDGRLTLDLPETGPPALRLEGDLRLRNAFLRMGLPIEVDSIPSLRLDLRYEGNHVRAMGTITGLQGRMAERRLSNASFQFTYVAPKLTIEEFSGDFEGGRLQSSAPKPKAPPPSWPSTSCPLPLLLSASMRGVDVGLLLAGVFNSDFANEGRLDGDMRLSGDVDHLTEVQGNGVALLTDSALWAIPVFQSLFTQLGFDSTATFKRMEARFLVGGGRIDLGHMQIKSDLLSLVGSGWVDFAGDMHQDMEVRYSWWISSARSPNCCIASRTACCAFRSAGTCPARASAWAASSRRSSNKATGRGNCPCPV
ncbi:MAG: AsmA-like C-terminal region-containing protein [Planctomycetota bacterium]